MATKRVFITGGHGFIGSRVTRRLVARGDAVTLLVRPASDLRRVAELDVARTVGDILDASSLNAMADHDACVHLACISSWNEQRNASMETTILAGTENVLRAAAANGVRRVVFVSSAAAVAGTLAPVVANESTPFPDDCRALRYAVAKHEAETRAVALAEELGLELVVVNPAEVYGPEDYALVTAGNLRDVLSSWPAMACSGGTAVTHVDDVADGIVAALDRGRSGERYILGGDNLTVRELVTMTLRSAKRRAPVVTVPSWVLYAVVRFCGWLKVAPPMHPDVVPYATRYWFVDSSKAKAELGYAPRSAAATLDETVAWLQHHLRGTNAA